MGLLAAIRGHGPEPGHFKGLVDGAKIWWVGPNSTSIDASQIWPQLKRSLRFAISSPQDKNETTRTINLPNGGYISVRSADGQNRGAGLDGLIFDEAAFAEERVWKEDLRATIADHDGWLILQSTPNGRNWMHKEWEACVSRARWERWQRPSRENPLMTQPVLDELKDEIGPRRFAQEYEAQFMEVEGALWPAEYFGEHIWAEDWPDAFQCFTIGVDPSMGASETADYSAIVGVGLARGLLWVDSSIRRRPPGEIVADTVSMAQRYGADAVGVESDGFQGVLSPLFEHYCRNHRCTPLPLYKIKSQGKSKSARIQRLDAHLAAKRFRLRRSPGNSILIEQMMMFPLKAYHDDGPDALEMAVRLLNQTMSRGVQMEERVRA